MTFLTSPQTTPSHPRLNEYGYWQPGDDRHRLVVYSGAGLSAESGLKTFRGDDGLWENHPIEQVCDGRTWREHREVVERFYAGLQAADRAAKPHAGHAWCSQMEDAGAVLLTQNVDTLLERAGARHVIHLHGQLDMRQCFGCSGQWQAVMAPGACPFCQSPDTRAAVVFFREPAPAYTVASKVLGGLRARDTLVVVGTQASVANPLRWLTGPCNLVVVDPHPASRLANWPGARVLAYPASRLPEALAELAA